MSGARRLDVLARFAADAAEPGRPRLCRVAADVVGVSGAGIMLMTNGTSASTVCTTDPVSALVEELQFALGEGPCIDAIRDGLPVSEPDLEHPVTVRWTAFTPPALEAGVRGIFGFPLSIGAARFGALDLYCDRAGHLSADQFADAVVAAEVIARVVAGMQADAPSEALAPDLGASDDFRLVVHQAAGMVSIQLGVSIDDALSRLRAHAFAENRSITEVARSIVERTLRLDGPDGDRSGR